ncbi:MAG: DUF4373 domain-containing protein [Candidatus Spyradocola sp.]
MARPRKNGLRYFPLDVDFFEEDRLLLLEARGGSSFLVLYLRLLCQIHRGEGGPWYAWGETQATLLARRVADATPEQAQRCVEACLELGLFDPEIFAREGLLTSREAQRSYFVAAASRLRTRLKRGVDCVLPAGRLLFSADELYDLIGFAPGVRPEGRFLLQSDSKSGSQDDSVVCSAQTPQTRPDKTRENQTRAEEREAPRRAAACASPSSAEASVSAAPPVCFGAVALPRAAFDALCAQYGRQAVEAKALHMDAWLRERGRRVRSFPDLLRDWLAQDAAAVAPPFSAPPAAPPQAAPPGKRTGAHNFTQRSYTDEQFDALLEANRAELFGPPQGEAIH